jgi:hypothetical protein
MPAVLEQVAYNTIGKEQGRTCVALFSRPTKPGSLIWVVVAAAGTLPSRIAFSSGYTKIGERGQRDIQSVVYFRQNAPSTLWVSATSLDADKSIQIRALEYSGVAQANALDRVNIESSDSDSPHTGSTGTTAQADELVIATVINQYASTTQYGWSGGLVRLYDTTSPQKYGGDSDSDWERSRLSVHHAIVNKTGSWELEGDLSTERRWQAYITTFRGGTTGPARFTSTQQGPMLQTGGTGSLTVFGPLQSTVTGLGVPMLRTGSAVARVGPFVYQYRLGGWNGLLLGDDTPYRVESTEGLEGWEIRTSDDELPRGDGALRGVDLQASRQVLFKLKVGGTQDEVEELMDNLYRALVPQRNEDWDLIWRHPGRPLRMIRCRPINLSRELSWRETLINHQSFALLAADPRHYSASPRQLIVPNTPAGASQPIFASMINEGNGWVYPVIRIAGPATGDPVSRIELINQTSDQAFVVQAILPANATLVGDMEARATGAPRSVVTIDGQSKYGAWQQPRQTFSLGPGENRLYLNTVPAGAPVTCLIEYRDTWSG